MEGNYKGESDRTTRISRVIEVIGSVAGRALEAHKPDEY